MIIADISQGNTYPTNYKLYKYDYGRILRIQGMNLPAAVEIDFCLSEKGGDSIKRIGTTVDGVTDVPIPDSMLENNYTTEDYYLYAFIYLDDGTSGQTVRKITLKVTARPKPGGIEDDPELEETTFNQIMSAVNKIADGKADMLDYKGNILRLLSGEKELSSVTIADGAPGKDGADGITPHIGDNGNWYIGETDTGVKAEAPSTDSTLTESGKAADAKITGEKISELKGEIDYLKQAGTGSGSGVTVAQSNSLWAIIQKAAFAEALTDEELNDFKTAWGITTENIPATGITLDKSTLSFTDSASQTLVATVEPSDTTDKVVWTSNAESVATVANGVVKPVSNGSATITVTCGSVLATCSVTVDIAEEEQVTLTSISATYTGGEVAVGTALTALTGITVTGTYSDGSTATITGYTLSGTIVEGSNTITVSYGGKTTTFTVTGVAESKEAIVYVDEGFLAGGTTVDAQPTVSSSYKYAMTTSAILVKGGETLTVEFSGNYGSNIRQRLFLLDGSSEGDGTYSNIYTNNRKEDMYVRFVTWNVENTVVSISNTDGTTYTIVDNR